MTRIAIAVALALAATAAPSVAEATPAVGDVVLYRVGTSQYNLGIVGRVVSGNNVDLQVFSDGTTWADSGAPAQVSIITYLNVALGNSVSQYQATAIIANAAAAGGAATQAYVTSAISTATSGLASSSSVSTAISTATSGLASTAYVDAATAAAEASAEGYVDALTAGYVKLPAAAFSLGLTLNGSGTLVSSTRPALVVVRGTASQVSTLGTGQGFTVDLRCDSASTPTTVLDQDSGSYTDALGVTTTSLVPFKIVAMAAAGEKCRVVQSAGSATLSVTGSTARPL